MGSARVQAFDFITPYHELAFGENPAGSQDSGTANLSLLAVPRLANELGLTNALFIIATSIISGFMLSI
ncbi:MAG: hypothetical protein LBJ26_21150 [Paenibacillus sp.]|nr:hypothetical protein [Paenibacillus sp.]MDR0270576.1 hypothetical protein [Paenibacillus sp.]